MSGRTVAGVVLALSLAGCTPVSPAPRAGDRRVGFAGVSILVPSGVLWRKAPRGPRMTATYGRAETPWCDVTEVRGFGVTPEGPRKEAERRWKGYRPLLSRANGGAAIPPASWSKLGTNDYLSVRFRTNRGVEMRTGYVVVGDRLAMLAIEYPETGSRPDPLALPALERLAASLRPLASDPPDHTPSAR